MKPMIVRVSRFAAKGAPRNNPCVSTRHFCSLLFTRRRLMISGHKFYFLFLRLSLVLYAGAFHCPQTLAQQHDFWGENSKGAPAPGQHAFNTNCAGCHGLDGRGSDKGPKIAASVNVRHLSDARISRIISDGIAGTGMPAFHSFSEQQTRAIVGYI